MAYYLPGLLIGQSVDIFVDGRNDVCMTDKWLGHGIIAQDCHTGNEQQRGGSSQHDSGFTDGMRGVWGIPWSVLSEILHTDCFHGMALGFSAFASLCVFFYIFSNFLCCVMIVCLQCADTLSCDGRYISIRHIVVVSQTECYALLRRECEQG